MQFFSYITEWVDLGMVKCKDNTKYSVEDKIKKSSWWWLEHLQKMNGMRIPNQAFHDLLEVKTDIGCRRKRAEAEA
jgi:hypothetical protein